MSPKLDHDYPIGPMPPPSPREQAWHDQVTTRAGKQLDLLVNGYGLADYQFGQFHNETNLAGTMMVNYRLSRADLIDILVVAVRRLHQTRQEEPTDD